MKGKIVLIGGGGHSKVIIDVIKSRNEFDIKGITEKNKKGSMLGVPIIGNDDILKNIYREGIENAFLCIGSISNTRIRNNIFNNLKTIGFKLPILFHKTAIISPYSKLSEGTCVMSRAVINPSVNIEKNCVINTGVIIEHDCKISSNVQISPGTVISGEVSIGKDTFVGANSTIIQGINIGENVTIGAGSVVIKDLPDNCVAVGNPAKIIKYK